MKFTPHTAFEGTVDQLMLGHPGFARKGLRHHMGGIMIAVAGQVLDGHLCIGQGVLDQALNLAPDSA